MLTALDHFYDHLGLGHAVARREDLPAAAPRALDEAEQRRFLRQAEKLDSARDKAIAYLLFYTGIRVAELTALDEDDVPISARKGKVIVRSGKGDRFREVPLHGEPRPIVQAWRADRADWPGAGETTALFLNRYGNRLSDRSVDERIAQLGTDAGIEGLTPHVLRHTFGTRLLRGGADVVLVAELMGHARLGTTRRYTLPTAADREQAIELLLVDR
ncbi:tyrosine-type recombinase/integrase [Cryptosporangium sp. NPDC048952]|uniref:tyrosine-type recombinase/integrase n=1 Tax=Cryptosporangium sp. NPDC048952 TaxID=3363961 RepID=UPI00371EA9FC